MQVYLYGIVPAGEAPLAALEGMAGVTAGAFAAIPAGPVALVVSGHDGSELLQTRRRMLAHTRVLEALMTSSPVLPMRFGLVSEDVGATAARIAAEESKIAAQFARITGRVEVGLRVSWPREAALDRLLEVEPSLAAARDRLLGQGHGAHFARIELGRRVAEALERRRTETQRRLLAALRPLWADHVLRAPEEDVEALRLECLVPESGEGALAEAALTAARGCDFAPGAEPAIRLVGPVPPFHFVELAIGHDPDQAAA